VLSTLFLTPGGNDATHFGTFQAAYNAARRGDVIQVEPGAVVSDPSGTIVISKSITLQGNPAFGRAPVASNVSVRLGLEPSPTTAVLQHLDFGTRSVTTGGSPPAATAIKDSTLHNVQAEGFGLNSTIISGNTITGSLILGDELGDQVTNNNFQITDAGTHAAITVAGVSTVTSAHTRTIITGNTIEFHTQSASNAGLVINVSWADPLVVADNTFDTNRAGTGLVIHDEGVGVKVEGNDFNANHVGVAIDAESSAPPGSIDLGGGPLGCRGLNSFVSFTGNDGRLAIALTDSDPNYVVHARGNGWSPLIDPHSAIEDGSHHGGTGIIDVEMAAPPGGWGSGGGSGTSPSYPLGVWPSSFNVPGSTPAASHPPVQRMM
jgi:hypothetical protein